MGLEKGMEGTEIVVPEVVGGGEIVERAVVESKEFGRGVVWGGGGGGEVGEVEKPGAEVVGVLEDGSLVGKFGEG